VNLAGRTVLVTGATGGLGQAIARGLAARGASLLLTGRQEDVLEPLAEELRARSLVCDLGDRAQLERLAADARGADVLVANAAVPAGGMIGELSVEEMDRALDVNLRAPMLLARLLGEGMAARGDGHIVFVNSLSGKAGAVGTSLYAATKFGLRGFAQGIREDLRPRGVGVSTVFPSFIRDAGMFHDSGAELPPYVGMKAPEDVARAVIRAIERDRSEIVVAPMALRVGAAVASIAPEASAIVQRRLGATEIAVRVVNGQRAKRAGDREPSGEDGSREPSGEDGSREPSGADGSAPGA
jgi:short-subunit dehydrogenase